MIRTETYSKAVWRAAENLQRYPSLTKDIEVDVAIVGAGITGLSVAYHLIKAGKSVAVLEAFEVGRGTTGSSTGNLYIPVDERLFSIGTKHNEETMRRVAHSRKMAIDFIEQCIGEYAIDCEFQRVPWYLFTTPDSQNDSKTVKNEFQAALAAGLTVADTPPAGFPFEVDAITNLPGQAQFNALLYVQHLSAALAREGCLIFENSPVRRVTDGEPCEVQTDSGTVKAKKVAMATHTPKGIYAVHTAMESYREYALAVRLKGELPAPGAYWHLDSGSHHSIRPYKSPSGNYLLVLGQAHKVGSKSNNTENFKILEDYLARYFDIEKVEYRWAAQNYKPADNLPYVGTSPMQDNVYIATGFAADGLVYGTLAGMIISDQILGIANDLARIYDPKRFTPAASASKFMKENISVGAHLLKDYLFYGTAKDLGEIKPGEGKTLKVDGERLAAYRDEQGHVHLVSSVCTHMGCIVHWNDAEKTWDCPCHGSRFATDGKVLEGPAFDNLARPRDVIPGKEKMD